MALFQQPTLLCHEHVEDYFSPCAHSSHCIIYVTCKRIHGGASHPICPPWDLQTSDSGICEYSLQ